jgi:hypothetical protein
MGKSIGMMYKCYKGLLSNQQLAQLVWQMNWNENHQSSKIEKYTDQNWNPKKLPEVINNRALLWLHSFFTVLFWSCLHLQMMSWLQPLGLHWWLLSQFLLQCLQLLHPIISLRFLLGMVHCWGSLKVYKVFTTDVLGCQMLCWHNVGKEGGGVCLATALPNAETHVEQDTRETVFPWTQTSSM